jgi:hypothetical protein
MMGKRSEGYDALLSWDFSYLWSFFFFFLCGGVIKCLHLWEYCTICREERSDRIDAMSIWATRKKKEEIIFALFS